MLSQEDRTSLEYRIAHLSAALKLIEKPENWIRGKRWDHKGAYCALGAIGHASPGLSIMATERQTREAECDLAAAIPIPVNALPPDPYNIWFGPGYSVQHHIARFNNTQSHEDVVEAFRTAIAKLKCRIICDDREREGVNEKVDA